jgi:YfiH family protein
MKNRETLKQALQLPSEPLWLEQVHGVEVADSQCAVECRADASYTDKPGIVCVVMTADCLPVLLADTQGNEVAVAHAGWKGLLNGVIEAALKKFKASPDNIHAWLGPAIGPKNFEVGAEVRLAYMHEAESSEVVKSAFQQLENKNNKFLADIYQLARFRLNRSGVRSVSGGDYCTVENKEMFYSYRRDGVTGRMASLIWIDEDIK